MQDHVNYALHFHREETGHDVQYKEEWVYDQAARCPHLPIVATVKVHLYGATRFQQAHAAIEFPDGSRWIMGLRMEIQSLHAPVGSELHHRDAPILRSEERRVGKECR